MNNQVFLQRFRWTTDHFPSETASALVSQAIGAMDRFTLPFIWAEDPTVGLAGQYGSGVLFEVEDRKFLLTAAHTLDEVLIKDRPTYFPGKQDAEVIPFGERECVFTTLPSSGRRLDDPIDLAVIDITDLANLLPDDRSFLTLDRLDADPTDTIGGLYSAYGYPASEFYLNRTMLIAQCNPYGYVGIPAPHEPKPFRLFEPTNHIAILIAHPDGDLPSIHPGGISGGGIWRLAQNERLSSDWRPEDVRLVAIEHVWEPRTRALSGTRISHALELIAHQWPKLKSELAQRFPYRDGKFFAWQVVLGGSLRLTPSGAIRFGIAEPSEEVSAFQWQAELDKRRGRLDEALSALNSALARAKDEAQVASVLLERAHIHHLIGRVHEALVDADKCVLTYRALRMDPRLPHALSVRGQILILAGKSQAALRDFSEAIRIAGELQFEIDEVNALVDRGGLYRTLRQFGPAQADLDAAVELATKTGERLGLANALRQRAEVVVATANRDLLEPTRDLNQALAIYAKTPSAIGEANASYLRGKIRVAQARPDASEDLNRSIALFAKLRDEIGRGNALFTRSRFYVNCQQYDEARVDLAMALEIFRSANVKLGQGNVHQFYGDLDCLAGNWESGIENFRRAVALHRASKEPRAVTQSLTRLAHACAFLQRWRDARVAGIEARRLAQRAGDVEAETRARDVLDVVRRKAPPGT